jgi:hypothetical protein
LAADLSRLPRIEALDCRAVNEAASAPWRRMRVK